jgi:SAM-dependent methyltransferase
MPVDTGLKREGMIYQRDQYAKGGIGVRYWDYRDRVAFRYVMGTDVLDLGCGEGITLEKLVKAFPDKHVVGLDTEAENIEICERHNLPVTLGSAYAIPFGDATFDTVLFAEVIEHLQAPDRALAEIRRVLRPHGRIIIIFPNDRTFLVTRLLMGMVREAFYDPGHVVQWTPGTMGRVLVRHGLKVLVGRSLPFLVWPLSLHFVVVAEKLQDAGS